MSENVKAVKTATRATKAAVEVVEKSSVLSKQNLVSAAAGAAVVAAVGAGVWWWKHRSAGDNEQV